MGIAALGVQLQLGRATELTAVSVEKSMASFKNFWEISTALLEHKSCATRFQGSDAY